MSWSLSRSGRAGKLAEVIKQIFADIGGAPTGSAEESAKNQFGVIAEALCKTLPPDKVVSISASGSAWNLGDGAANSQDARFEFISHGDFIE